MKTFSMQPGKEIMRIISCDVCGSIHFDDHWDCGNFRFKKCRSCGVVLQNPQPDPTQLLGRYDEEYFHYEIQNAQSYLNLMLLGMRDADFEDWESDIREFLSHKFEKIFGKTKTKEYIEGLNKVITDCIFKSALRQKKENPGLTKKKQVKPAIFE